MTSSTIAIMMLADRPELAAGWAELHWREWGEEPGREALTWWVEDASRAVRRRSVPVAFIALGDGDEVLGGVGVHEYDPEERRDRSPWIVGTIVRADRRSQGIGQALLERLEAWAVAVGIAQLWVSTETEGRAVAFYQRCGYQRIEDMLSQSGVLVTVLTKRLSSDRNS
jgi:GNAT superfamily N-acetyltransferase